jgi:hypothetical protein
LFDPSTDGSFAHQLEQRILRILSGDPETMGLYRALVSCQDWQQFKFTTGEIKGYETVLQLMLEIARGMNQENAASRESDRRLS